MSKTPDILNRIKDFAAEFDTHYSDFLRGPADVPPELLDAMRYSALAPGKRLRPYLIVRCCELTGGLRQDAWAPAAALECVHAFSLVHDDLPAMDDDDLRRGLPTNHKKFGEAMAILAGDALLTIAFELIVREVEDSAQATAMVLALSKGVGWSGMIAGQVADIQGQDLPPSMELISYIQERKTASLFATSCQLGALAGHGTPELVAALTDFGRDLGLAFQMADDLLDVTATEEDLGKAVKKDANASKQTHTQCVGIDEARMLATDAAESAERRLGGFGPEADDLRQLARYVVDRDY